MNTPHARTSDHAYREISHNHTARTIGLPRMPPLCSHEWCSHTRLVLTNAHIHPLVLTNLTCSAVILPGNVTCILTNKSPLCEGTSCCGIPSPEIRLVSYGPVMPWELTSTSRSSRCLIVFLKPTRDSPREISMVMWRSLPRRSKRE